MDVLGEKLLELRKRKRISQEKMSEELNISRHVISKWENNQGNPNSKNFEKLCQYFQVDADYFLEDEPIQEVEKQIIEKKAIIQTGDVILEKDEDSLIKETEKQIIEEEAITQTERVLSEKDSDLSILYNRIKRFFLIGLAILVGICTSVLVFITVCIGIILFPLDPYVVYTINVDLSKFVFFCVISLFFLIIFIGLLESIHKLNKWNNFK